MKAIRDNISCLAAMMLANVRLKYDADPGIGSSQRSQPASRKTFDKFELGGQACIMGLNRSDFKVVSGVFATGGLKYCEFLPQIQDLGKLTSLSSDLSHLVINIDIFESLEVAVDFQIAFRNTNPAVQIFMISSSVARDDFGSHRASICNVTMRSPISEGRFKAALVAVGMTQTMRKTSFAEIKPLSLSEYDRVQRFRLLNVNEN